jgi:hypothetical protein
MIWLNNLTCIAGKRGVSRKYPREEQMMQSTVPNLTRRGILDLAQKEMGLPLSKSWLDQLAMRGRGPKPIGRVGIRHVCARDEVLRWIASDLVKPLEGGRKRRINGGT